MSIDIDYLTAPLSEFGQKPSPAPGASLKRVVSKNEDQDEYLDRTKSRYVWMPLHDISLIGNTNQPMSVSYIYRGRVAWLQSVTYKGTDYSIEAFDMPGEEELPLKRFSMTPKAQALYLHINYTTKGIRIFEHLKNEEPETVAAIEQTLLPEVPVDLISLAEYLQKTSPNNIQRSALNDKEKELAWQTLRSMAEGTSTAIGYSRELIAESEREVLNRRNRGSGKAELDNNDKFAYAMLRRVIPTEMTLENSSEARQTMLLEKLVDVIQKRDQGNQVPAVEASTDQVRALEEKLLDMQQQLLEMSTRLPQAPTIEAPFEYAEVAMEEPVAVPKSDLKDRLDKSKRR